jgi:hypothetical protein
MTHIKPSTVLVGAVSALIVGGAIIALGLFFLHSALN